MREALSTFFLLIGIAAIVAAIAFPIAIYNYRIDAEMVRNGYVYIPSIPGHWEKVKQIPGGIMTNNRNESGNP